VSDGNGKRPAAVSVIAAADEIERKGIAGVILCGGKGTRMRQTRTHKVCVSVVDRPAVVRLIDTLRADGVDPVVVVVGHRAGDVVETIGADHPGVHFVYQRDQLGTGHAARIGVEALCQFGYDGPVLITMGDKWFAPGLVANALKKFRRSQADLLVASTPNRPESAAGRLVNIPRRGVVGNVELRDIQRARVLSDWLELTPHKKVIPKSTLRRAGLKWIRPTKKLWRALGPLARFCRGSGSVQASELAQVIRETGLSIQVGGTHLAPDQVERRSTTVNESIYIGNTTVLQSALYRVGRDNAQDEYYLTDTIAIVAGHKGSSPELGNGRVVEYRLKSREIMAFNTRAELARIEEHVRQSEYDAAREAADKRLASRLRKPDQWRKILDPALSRGRRLIEKTYGVGGPLVNERLQALRRVARLFGQVYGQDRKFFLVRAPGRINLMGRHIDHQGGFVHVVALDCEVLMAVSPRKDNVIRLVNSDPVAFPTREIVLSDWTAALQRSRDWLRFVDGPLVRAHLMSTSGDWSNYVLAAALYQQYHHMNRRLRGMDVAVSGNVPMAAGLSSSSSLVVASMEAVTAVNGIQATASDIVNACGQAEWFVGSRGGAADHAAIRLGEAGKVARMGFHPFRISRYVSIPEDAALLLAYSGEHAVKSAGARDRFNERVACYRLGILLLRRRYPRFASRLEHIRDLSPSRLNIEPAKVLEMIQGLPTKMTRRQLRRELGREFDDHLKRIFASHGDPGAYTIRDVVAFGVGECERSERAATHLARNDLEGFGRLMLFSHDGDRVSGTPACREFLSCDTGSVNSMPLHLLVGAYACSTENIDQLVDIARHLPGVYGAQLAGAGLGGCVMILVKRVVANRVKSVLAKTYYRPRDMVPAVWQVRSVSAGGFDGLWSSA